MPRPITITIYCPECEAATDVQVCPGEREVRHAPAEHCHPGSDPYFEPRECECGEPFDRAEVFETAYDATERHHP